MSTLYDRLGGSQAISSVVQKFYQFMLKDNRVAYFFTNTDMKKQTQSQKQFITLVCGGPHQYHGKDMKCAHKGMGIGHMEFDATWENLLKSLTHFKVPQHEISQLKQIFYSVEDQIVELKSNNNETSTKNKDPNLDKEQSLYQKLGGHQAVSLVVNKFYEFMLKDERVNFYFANTDMKKQKDSQIQFISMVTGGPVVYKGKDMKVAHCPYKISEKEFDATWQNLLKALNTYNVPSVLSSELKQIFYSVEGDIVNVKSTPQNRSKQSLLPSQSCPFNNKVTSQSKQQKQQSHEKSLYDRLGGHGGLYLVVNKFYDLLLTDPLVNFYFNNTDMSRQRSSQIQFLSMVTGGDVLYKGKDMKQAHCPYKINEMEFDRTWLHLEQGMRYYKVGQGLIREVKEIFYSVQGDIVRDHTLGKRQNNTHTKHQQKKQQQQNTNNHHHNHNEDNIKEQSTLPITISSHSPNNHFNQHQQTLLTSPQSPKNNQHQQTGRMSHSPSSFSNTQQQQTFPKCPFQKISEQQKRQLKQQFIQSQQNKQVRKLSNSPYTKTFY